MIANLLNCALEASSSIDEHGIAYMMLTLATTFHRVCFQLLNNINIRNSVIILEIKRRSYTVYLYRNPTSCCLDEYAILGNVVLF